MAKFVSFDKLSKKKKKQLNAERRKSWNGTSPVTRKAESKKKYSRKKIKARLSDDDFT